MSEQEKDPKSVDTESMAADENQGKEKVVNPDADASESQADGQETSSDVEQGAEKMHEQGQEDESPELAAARDEITKLKDAYLRAKAEEDNVRRRTEKEVANSRKFAVEGFAKEMLQVRDSLKLAVAVELDENADESIKSVHEGVNITLKQLDAAFGKFSLQEISPEVGDKLDPNLHQAMSIVESEDVESGCILNVIQAGFQLHDRLLRPAMVVVAK